MPRASRSREARGKKRPAHEQPGRAAKKQKKDYRAEVTLEDVGEEEADDQELFKVEKIVDRKIDRNGVALYKTRWKGYSASDDTWEPTPNVASTGHIDRFERQERQKTLKSTDPGVAVIEYEDGERSRVDLGMEKFRSYQEDSDPERDDDTVNGDDDVNNFGLVVEGEWIEILWPHANIYFPAKVITWTPLEVKRSKRKKKKSKRASAEDEELSLSDSPHEVKKRKKKKKSKLESSEEEEELSVKRKNRSKRAFEEDEESSVPDSIQSRQKDVKQKEKKHGSTRSDVQQATKKKKKKHRQEEDLEDEEDVQSVSNSIRSSQKEVKSSSKKEPKKGDDGTSIHQADIAAPPSSPESEPEPEQAEPTQQMFWADKSDESVHKLRVHMADRNDSDDQSLNSDSSEDSYDKPVERVGHGVPLFDEPEDDFDSSSGDEDSSDDEDEEGHSMTNGYHHPNPNHRERPLSFEEMWTEKLRQTQELIDRGAGIGGI